MLQPQSATRVQAQKLAYVYFEDEPGRRSAAKLLTKIRRIFCGITGADTYCCGELGPIDSHHVSPEEVVA
jgi:hypothetical protein